MRLRVWQREGEDPVVESSMGPETGRKLPHVSRNRLLFSCASTIHGRPSQLRSERLDAGLSNSISPPAPLQHAGEE